MPGSTDLNSTPDSAIERVEVLQDGASAIYGSDAIAGVVNTFLRNFDVVIRGPTGPQELSREGTQVGSPAQVFPKWKSIGVVDLDWANFGVTAIGRYVSKLEETGGNVMDSLFYTDLQLRWTPEERFNFALGVNNLFDKATPGCVTCEANNFSQSVHDIPGRYFYARASFRM